MTMNYYVLIMPQVVLGITYLTHNHQSVKTHFSCCKSFSTAASNSFLSIKDYLQISNFVINYYCTILTNTPPQYTPSSFTLILIVPWPPSEAYIYYGTKTIVVGLQRYFQTRKYFVMCNVLLFTLNKSSKADLLIKEASEQKVYWSLLEERKRFCLNYLCVILFIILKVR